MTQNEWEDESDRELDAGLTALFQSVESLQPPAGFALRTMRAVRREPLMAVTPPGRPSASVQGTGPRGVAPSTCTTCTTCPPLDSSATVKKLPDTDTGCLSIDTSAASPPITTRHRPA